jgi:hypothetical protein
LARIRNIKPDFFMSEDIGALTVHARLLYIALWTQADTEGKMRYARTALSAQCMPFEMGKFDDTLAELIDSGLVVRYEVVAREYLFIPTFTEHQKPHHSEKPKGYPDPEPLNNGANTVKAPEKGAREGKGKKEGEEGRREGDQTRARTHTHAGDWPPPWLDVATWQKWQTYRLEKGFRPSNTERQAQLDFLAQHQADHVAIIEQSIRSGWSTLQPLGPPGKQQGHEYTDEERQQFGMGPA